MKTKRPVIVVASLAVLLASCQSTGPSDRTLAVRNDTGLALVVLPLAPELAARIDLAPEIELAGHAGLIVRPGEELRLIGDQVMGEFDPREGLVLFLYEVGNRIATYAGVKTVAWLDPEATLHRLTIRPRDLRGG